MSDIIIKAENVGKSYLIGHQRQQGYTALRDVVSQKVRGAAKNIKNTLTGKQLIAGQEIEEFWALKDVSFEINQGDAVGIIGRNGAGKSTLLKVLSRITEPTTGRITLNGRVASLLEVGTGFHPELTGRENIYLNGAILGMSRAEIKKKFDEIVDFSGVEKFLDTPVKRYSSGMYVRLAFSVAAHLEPEILVVDEVLAVGDAEFQKKCLGKMGEVSKNEGRTVLFVSHNLMAVTSLCTRGILMNQGALLKTGNITDVISAYHLLNNVSSENYKSWEKEKAPSNFGCKLKSVDIINVANAGAAIKTDDIFEVKITYCTLNEDARVGLTVILSDINDSIVFSSINNHEQNYYSKTMPMGIYTSVCTIPGNFLNYGRF